VLLDLRVLLELLGSKVVLESMGHRVPQVQWVCQEHLETTELTERLEALGRWELLDRTGPWVTQVRLAQSETRAKRELMGKLGVPDQLVR